MIFKQVVFRYLTAQTITGLVPLILLPFYTYKFSAQQYGAYALALLVTSVFSGIGNLGLATIFERNVHEYKLKSERIVYLLNIVSLVSLVLFLLWWLSYFTLEYLLQFIRIELSKSFVLIAMAAMFTKSIQDYFLLFYKQNKETKQFIQLKFVESFGSNAFIIILILVFNQNIEALFYGVLFSSSLNILWALFSLINALEEKPYWRMDLRSSLKLSIPLTPRIFFGVINTKFDKYLLGLLGTMGGVGVYEIAQRIANITFLFQTSLENVFGPSSYEKLFNSKETNREELANYLTPFFYITTGFALLLCLLSQELFFLFFPTEYHSGIDVVIILSTLYALYFFGKIPQLLYAKKTYLITFITILNIALNIGLNLYLIPKYGLFGAAFATFLAGGLTGLYSFYLSQKYSPIKWNYSLLGIIIVYLFCSVITLILLRKSYIDYPLIIAIKCTFLLGYITLGKFFKIKIHLDF